jgi:hypothetical protein
MPYFLAPRHTAGMESEEKLCLPWSKTVKAQALQRSYINPAIVSQNSLGGDG